MKTFFLILCSLVMGCVVVAQKPGVKEYTYDEIHKNLEQEENKSIKFNTVGILVYDGFFELDAIGPQAALSSVSGTKVFFVAKKKGLVKGVNNTYQVDHDFSDVDSLDILIIPGGLQGSYITARDAATLNWIKKIDRTTSVTASVCTGSWILGATGLLKGKTVTSNWYRAKEIMEQYGTNFQEKRWIKDGKYWTAAGVSAGIDMGLSMVEAAKGKTYTEFVMLNLEYDPQPPFPGGSVQNTNPGIVKMLTEMYDMGLKKLKNSEKNDGQP